MLVCVKIIVSSAALLAKGVFRRIFMLRSLERLVNDPKVMKSHRKTYSWDLGLSNSLFIFMLRIWTKLVMRVAVDFASDALRRTVSQKTLNSYRLLTALYSK